MRARAGVAGVVVAVAVAAVACKRSPPPSAAPAKAAPPTLSDETRARGQQTIEQSCQMCHALDLVQSQRLGRATWEKELDKMIGWGAPVAADEVAAAVEVLSAQFGVDTPPSSPSSLSAAEIDASVALDEPRPGGDARHGAAVYRVACASCHGADGGGGPVGPALIERPILHRAHDFEAIVRDGRRRMPAVPLDAATMRDLFAFLRAAHG
ncbi:MAG: cytochrome c [Myxococcales bacterium]|nr:cytochrome c [Myxococcales bacterium]